EGAALVALGRARGRELGALAEGRGASAARRLLGRATQIPGAGAAWLSGGELLREAECLALLAGLERPSDARAEGAGVVVGYGRGGGVGGGVGRRVGGGMGGGDRRGGGCLGAGRGAGRVGGARGGLRRHRGRRLARGRWGGAGGRREGR